MVIGGVQWLHIVPHVVYRSPGDARFCSACGKPVTRARRPIAIPAALSILGILMRPLRRKKVAGVCQGLANQYGWDVTLIRVIAVLLAIMVFPVGVVAYVLFWVMVPEEPRGAPHDLTHSSIWIRAHLGSPNPDGSVKA